jgi:hypothetical protein
MAMTDRQLRWYRESDLKRLRVAIGDAPLTVRCRERDGGGTIFVVTDVHGLTFEGRFQIVASWIEGYRGAWSWSQ